MSITLIPFNMQGKIYRAPMPFGHFDNQQNTWQQFLDKEINIVVMLTPREEAIQRSGMDLYERYQENGIEVLYFPIDDFGVPEDTEALIKSVELAIFHLEDGCNLAVHCFAGIGRTGLFLALMARKIFNMHGETAIQWIRDFVPGAVESPNQYNLVVNAKF